VFCPRVQSDHNTRILMTDSAGTYNEIHGHLGNAG
jgi:hypothetical protein